MGRGSKPAKSKVGAKVPVNRKASKNENALVRDLAKRLTEALDQQRATSEILRLISNAPNNAQSVFQAIAESAARLCRAHRLVVFQVQSEMIEPVAVAGDDQEALALYRSRFSVPVSAERLGAQAVRERKIIHVPHAEDPDLPEIYREMSRRFGTRAFLIVPILRDMSAQGVILAVRREPVPFSETEIALLKTFADQAAIAIEDVRLVKELGTKNHDLTDALAQQTAVSDILKIVSRSAFELQSVFEAIVERATRLCGASNGVIYQFDGDVARLAVAFNTAPELRDFLERNPVSPGRSSTTGRVLLERRTIHIDDVLKDGEYRFVERMGVRTTLGVPMIREDGLLGVIVIWRNEVKPFTDRQVELVTTFADQAVIAIENVRLFTELQEKNRALTQAHAHVSESLEQQTATAEILQVISRSPTMVEPVFEALVASASRLCQAPDVAMLLVEGDELRIAAGVGPLYMSIPAGFRIPLTRGSAATRAVLDRAIIHIHDFAAEPEEEYPVGRELARRFGHRSMLAVPLVREGVPIGVICAFRLEVRPFPSQLIALLRTFADQAVIAIENVRLFTDLQHKNQALTEAHAQVTETLEQQTATSEILRVISQSPTDMQPVFDAIVESARRLLNGLSAIVTRLVGDELHLSALTRTTEAGDALVKSGFPVPLAHGSLPAQVVRGRAPSFVSDIETDERFPAGRREVARARGYRSIVHVPLLREGHAIGTIGVTRPEAGPFSPDEIALLKTFADQAVIAIENVRLFTELQEKNQALTQAHAQVTESLEQQTATAEVLRLIAGSPTDLERVLGTVAETAMRVCGARDAIIYRCDGEVLRLACTRGPLPVSPSSLILPLNQKTVTGRSVVERRTIHVHDLAAVAASEYPEALSRGVAAGSRTVLATPLLQDGEPLGAILIRRGEVQAFTDKQIALLETFADQAVIAIENVRLFTELQARTADLTRSVGQLTALGEVGQAVSSSLDLETVLTTIVSRAVQLSGLDGGVVFEYDEAAEKFVQRAAIGTANRATAAREAGIRKGEGVVGRTAQTLQPVQIPDISVAGAYEGRTREELIAAGVRALVAVPILREGRLIGGLAVNRNQPGEFQPEMIELLRTFATQSSLAIQNARLFRELADKSHQLEAASQHKSEFLANMSHELRTPLNAIIGFSEVLSEKMFGELNEKQEEYSKDIHASGQHLLSLINDILDLSKIEAGRMELELSEFDLPTALENALMLIRERAGRRSIALHMNIDARLGQMRADERKVRQVVLNLLSNAIKFTQEGGRIDVGAVPKDGHVEISVSDTGVGIAPEDQEAVFEEFRQVGMADKKVEGTGLGLTLCRKFVELHGGKIWVKSQLGEGSTFTFTIPVRRGE